MESKFYSIDHKVDGLRELRIRAHSAVVADFDEKFDLSWIYHDNALEGVQIRVVVHNLEEDADVTEQEFAAFRRDARAVQSSELAEGVEQVAPSAGLDRY